MIIKKKLIKRIGAVLFAVVVVMGCLGSVPYYAEDFVDDSDSCYEHALKNFIKYVDVHDNYSIYGNYKYAGNYAYNMYLKKTTQDTVYCLLSNSPIRFVVESDPGVADLDNYHQFFLYACSDSPIYGYFSSGSGWSTLNSVGYGTTKMRIGLVYYDFRTDVFKNNFNPQFILTWTNQSVYINDILICNEDGSVGPAYNSTLGYLQNVTRKSTYIRGELFNYDDESLTYHWYHDLTSTTGIDLTNGNYIIRHYISNATVKGYEKSDIIEMSDRYLMAEYDASQGYFSYLQKEYLEKIENLGYVEPSWFDTIFRGYFTLQHHYLQIVDTSTNEVGGYLHFYPKDASGDSFGVELEYEGLDDKFEVDEDGPSGFIDTPTGSGTTVEDALENADQPKLDDLGGIEPLIENIEGYASQITNVTNGIGALFGSLPPWVLGLLGLSVGMLFVSIVIKALRG